MCPGAENAAKRPGGVFPFLLYTHQHTGTIEISDSYISFLFFTL